MVQVVIEVGVFWCCVFFWIFVVIEVVVECFEDVCGQICVFEDCLYEVVDCCFIVGFGNIDDLQFVVWMFEEMCSDWCYQRLWVL